MAKPLSSGLKPIGTFFAFTSQNTKQAPSPNAADVAKPGVLSGYPYAVYFAAMIDNILWVLLDSATAGKSEWARADMDTSTGPIVYGQFVKF